MSTKGEGPRRVGDEAIDDRDLDGMQSEDDMRMAARETGPGPDYVTCWSGWTFICERHPPGQTCKTGWTFKCDTGTCHSGWTLWCEDPPRFS
jgi:hypothetical protein